jgi:hypothetical protein
MVPAPDSDHTWTFIFTESQENGKLENYHHYIESKIKLSLKNMLQKVI